MMRMQSYLATVSVLALCATFSHSATGQVTTQRFEEGHFGADVRTRADTALLYANTIDRLAQTIETDIAGPQGDAVIAAIRSGDLAGLPSLPEDLRELITALGIEARIVDISPNPEMRDDRIIVMLPEGLMRNSVTRSDVERAARAAGIRTVARLQNSRITDSEGYFDLPSGMGNMPDQGVAAYIGIRGSDSVTSGGLGSVEFRTLACQDGFFGTGIIERREIERMTTLGGQEAVLPGDWTEVSRSCSPESATMVRFFDACPGQEQGQAVFEVRQILRKDPSDPFATEVVIDRSTMRQVGSGECISGSREDGSQNFLVEGHRHARREMALRLATSISDLGNGPNHVPRVVNQGAPVPGIPFPAATDEDFEFVRSCALDYGPVSLPAGFSGPTLFSGDVVWNRDYNRRETYFSDSRAEYILNYELVLDPNPYGWPAKGRMTIPTEHGPAPAGNGWYRFSESCTRDLSRVERDNPPRECAVNYPDFPIGTYSEARDGVGSYRQIRTRQPDLISIAWGPWYQTANSCYNRTTETVTEYRTIPVSMGGQICDQDQMRTRTDTTDRFAVGGVNIMQSHTQWVDTGGLRNCISLYQGQGEDDPWVSNNHASDQGGGGPTGSDNTGGDSGNNDASAPGTDGSGGGGDGGGGCFLTTVVSEMRGEADDGPTLSRLRAYRDGYMAQSPELKPFIAEYYRVAPIIVSRIPRDHLDWIWIGEQIDICISLIDAGDGVGTFEVYRAMVETLKRRWLETQERTK